MYQAITMNLSRKQSQMALAYLRRWQNRRREVIWNEVNMYVLKHDATFCQFSGS
jgi:hypothetical protein